MEMKASIKCQKKEVTVESIVHGGIRIVEVNKGFNVSLDLMEEVVMWVTEWLLKL